MKIEENKPTKSEVNKNSGSEINPTKPRVNKMDNFCEFDPSVMEWPIFKERMDNYFISGEITDVKRMAAFLLTKLCEEVFKLLKNQAHPKLLKDMTYVEMSALLDSFYGKPVSIFLEREKFYELKQKENERMYEWFSRIKNASSDCSFGTHLDHCLRDKFVTGLRSGAIRDKLEEYDEKLTMEDALKHAVKKETVIRCSPVAVASEFQLQQLSVKIKSDYIKAPVSSSLKSDQVKEKSDGESKCYRCGKGNHDFNKCFHRSFTCNRCKKKGHLASVCKVLNYLENPETSRTADWEKEVEVFDLNTMFTVGEVMNSYTTNNADVVVKSIDEKEQVNTNKIHNLNNIQVTDETKAIKICVVIDNKRMSMEIDTGAAVSVLPFEFYE